MAWAPGKFRTSTIRDGKFRTSTIREDQNIHYLEKDRGRKDRDIHYLGKDRDIHYLASRALW